MPVRYLPVSTPRPSGDQASTPEPERLGGRHHLALDAALEQRVLDLGRRQPGPARRRQLVRRGLRRLPAGVVGDADVAGPAGRDGVVQRRRASPRAARRRTRCATCHRSTWSTPSRRSDASSARSSAPRDTSTTRSPRRPRDAGLGRDARGRRGRRPAEQMRRSAPRSRRRRSRPPCRRSVPPASTKARSWSSAASCSSVSVPQRQVPRPSRETFSPVEPTYRCFMARPYAARPAHTLARSARSDAG